MMVLSCANASTIEEPGAGKAHVRGCAGMPGNRRTYSETTYFPSKLNSILNNSILNQAMYIQVMKYSVPAEGKLPLPAESNNYAD